MLKRTVVFILMGCFLVVAAGRTAFAGPADEDLSTVAMRGDITAIRQALANGADVNKATDDGRTPLGVAAYLGHVDVVKLLLAAGADVNKADTDGETPLHEAAYVGHADMVKFLLASGTTPTQMDLADVKGKSRTLIQEALNRQTPSPS